MKSVISVHCAETNAIDSNATVDNEVSDLSALVTTETNAIDSAIATADNEVSDLSALVTTETNAIDSAIATVDNECCNCNEVSDLSALVTAETNDWILQSQPLTMKLVISVPSLLLRPTRLIPPSQPLIMKSVISVH